MALRTEYKDAFTEKHGVKLGWGHTFVCFHFIFKLQGNVSKRLHVLNSVPALPVPLSSSKSRVHLLKDHDPVGVSASRSVRFERDSIPYFRYQTRHWVEYVPTLSTRIPCQTSKCCPPCHRAHYELSFIESDGIK